jgi:hypothetical protein
MEKSDYFFDCEYNQAWSDGKVRPTIHLVRVSRADACRLITIAHELESDYFSSRKVNVTPSDLRILGKHLLEIAGRLSKQEAKLSK